MGKLVKFKSLGIELEGDMVGTERGITFVKTPFSGAVYAVKDEDIMIDDDNKLHHHTICTSSIIVIEDWTQGVSGKCLIQWEHHTDVDSGEVSSYVKIPSQKILIEWSEPDQDGLFESWLIVNEMYENDGIQLNNETTKKLTPSKLIMDIGAKLTVEF